MLSSVQTFHPKPRNYGLGLGMPTISLGSYRIGSGSSSALLPTSALSSNSNRKGSASAFGGKRRNKAQRWLWPLILVSLGLFAYVTLGAAEPEPDHILVARSTSSEHLPQSPSFPSRGRHNGVSLLDLDEDDLVEDDDVYYSSATLHVTPEVDLDEKERQAEDAAREAVVETQEKTHQLLAIAYFIAQGGILDNGFEVPSKKSLKELGGRGLEKLLVLSDFEWAEEKRREGGGDEGVELEAFEEGWQDFAKKSYKLIIFSKSYCPYSTNAKKIINRYELTVKPLIIELDKRTDGQKLQSLLQALSGRRTVPNIILNSESIGGSDEMELYHSEGGLTKMFNDAQILKTSFAAGT